jgi:general stress protein 26
MLTPAERQKIVAILDAAIDLTIATVREDGYPQATTVSFVNDGLAIYFGTWSQSQKTKNITRNNRISVTVNLPYKNWNEITGLSIGGRAQRLTDPAELGRVGAIMLKKFPQIQQYAETMQAPDMAMFRIDPEVLSVLDYAKGFGHTEAFDARPAAAA